MQKLNNLIIGVALVASGLFFGGCRSQTTNMMYMPHMVDGPAVKAQSAGSMMMPVKGTIPRGFTPYPYATDPEAAGRELKNPLRRTADVMARGQAMYNVYCLVCHGPSGEGDGTVVPKFPRPPSLLSEKVAQWTDGRIYHVLTVGQNLMPSYASQVDAGDRWAIIHYVRALQKSKNPTAEDLKAAAQ